MLDNELPSDCINAEGAEGLRKELDQLWDKSQNDPVFAAMPHYILYRLNQQKALIKVDMSERPVQFWYHDLLGRPATRIVKKTIAQFLMEKCGETDSFLQEIASR